MYPINNTDWSDKRILIVENDFASAYLVMELLQPTGVKILYVSEGTFALDICIRNAINLVIIGNKLQGDMKCIELLEMIKLANSEIPVFVYSADVDIYNKTRLYEAGCDFFIAKPVNLTQLHQVFFAYLSRSMKFNAT